MSDSKIKLRFADDQKSPTMEIGNGTYHRKFIAKDQPFECDKDEAAMLLRTGHFVELEAGVSKQAAQPAAASAPSTPTPPAVLGKIGGAPAGASEEQSGKS